MVVISIPHSTISDSIDIHLSVITMEYFGIILVLFLFFFIWFGLYSCLPELSRIDEYMRDPVNRGKSRKEIKRKVLKDNLTLSAGGALIASLFLCGIMAACDGCTEKSPQPKIDNYYKGSREQQEDIDFANELIRED